MAELEFLHPNEVISCLWSKNAPEKCRIGLADVVSETIDRFSFLWSLLISISLSEASGMMSVIIEVC